MIYLRKNGLVIRDLAPGDVSPLVEEERAQGWNSTPAKLETRLRDRAMGRAVALAAEYGGRAVGYINVYPHPTGGPFAGRGIPEIVDFAVLERFRGRGIGTLLMDAAEQVAGTFANEVYLGVGMHGGYGSAQRMYVKRGYVPDGGGVWYRNRVLSQDEACRNDDDLVLYLSKRLPQKGETDRTLDISHYYTERGAGFPLILLHGNGEDGGYFDPLIPLLSAEYRVLVPDTRGHGRTERGERPFTIRQFAEDLAGFMDRLGIRRAHLLGFSDGANIAMAFALRYPERTERLVLNGGNLNPAGLTCRVRLSLEAEYRLTSASQWLWSRMGKPAAAQKAARKRELLGLMTEDPMIRREDLASVQKRTLVVAGSHDMIKRKHTLAIAESIPDAEAVFLPGSHFVAAERPGEFSSLVLDFLKKETV